MRVVELNGDLYICNHFRILQHTNLLREAVEVLSLHFARAVLAGLEAADDVLKCCRAEEVLLLETELFAFEELQNRRYEKTFSANRNKRYHSGTARG